jgi:hypothetical protein
VSPRSNTSQHRAERLVGALACAVTAWLLLIPAGLRLVALAMAFSIPNSDTGERASTTAVTPR